MNQRVAELADQIKVKFPGLYRCHAEGMAKRYLALIHQGAATAAVIFEAAKEAVSQALQAEPRETSDPLQQDVWAKVFCDNITAQFLDLFRKPDPETDAHDKICQAGNAPTSTVPDGLIEKFPDRIRALTVGDLVKLGVSDEFDSPIEYLTFKILQVMGIWPDVVFTGQLMNSPAVLTSIKRGGLLKFGPDKIQDILTEIIPPDGNN
jgi:hypothetical protein